MFVEYNTLQVRVVLFIRMNMSSNDGSVLSEPSSPPDDGCSMDTVDTNNVIVKVSEKIIAGLERKKSFPSSSDYLGSICSDLRKVMRQRFDKRYLIDNVYLNLVLLLFLVVTNFYVAFKFCISILLVGSSYTSTLLIITKKIGLSC